MKMHVALVTAAGIALAVVEPEPRRPDPLPLSFQPRPHITSIIELPDGRLLLSDKRTPAVVVVDPKTGAATPVGSPGAGTGRYAQPGGLYGGAGQPVVLLDQGQMKAIAVTPAVTLGETRPYAPAGVSASTDADRDLYLLDGRGFSYFFDPDSRMRGLLAAPRDPTIDLVRFDPATQKTTRVATLRQRQARVIPGGDGMTFTRGVIGSPEDGWGVAADGRVAVVRAAPYRVDWYSPAGAETQGPAIEHDVLPMTQADRDAFTKAYAGGGVSIGMSSGGARGGTSGPGLLFADTKAPFEGDGVIVSPAGRVFVPRTRPAGASEVIYDVFDSRGRRTTRILLPADSRIVGFGVTAIYVREPASGGVTLKKYEVR